MSNNWIKTSDRLPEEYKRVLVTTCYGDIDIGDYSGNGSWFIGEGFYFETGEIPAWQPLPEVYREER